MTNNQIIIKGSSSYFIPRPFWSFEALSWLCNNIYNISTNPGGLYPSWFSLVMFLAGVYFMLRKNKKIVALLLFPIFLALLASGLHKYNFFQRFLIFCVPAILLIVCEGIVFFSGGFKHFSPLLRFTLAVIILFFPITTSTISFFNGYEKEAMKAPMSLLNEDHKNNDLLCINDKAYNAFLYYAGYYGTSKNITKYIKFTDRVYSDNGTPFVFYRYEYPVFNSNGYFIGIKNKSNLKKLYLNSEKVFFKDGTRAWLIFSHFNNSKPFILEHLNAFGLSQKALTVKNVAIYLYTQNK